MKPSFRSLWAKPSHLLALGFGTGLSPWAPGTVGSALALALFLPALLLPAAMQCILIVLAVIAGIALCDQAADDLRQKDPGMIVWDEFAGMWIAMAGLPLAWDAWPWLLAAFLLFRLLDILKPWPANWAERRVPGGAGIMLDDVVAGGYTLLAVQAAFWLLPA